MAAATIYDICRPRADVLAGSIAEADFAAEAAYWLGMAMHRKNPRWVLTALRTLLTEPRRKV